MTARERIYNLVDKDRSRTGMHVNHDVRGFGLKIKSSCTVSLQVLVL